MYNLYLTESHKPFCFFENLSTDTLFDVFATSLFLPEAQFTVTVRNPKGNVILQNGPAVFAEVIDKISENGKARGHWLI